MNSEIIQNVAYDNYDDFQHDNFIFPQNFISLFWGVFNDETDLSVRYPKQHLIQPVGQALRSYPCFP
jgi:hypothetical protein